MTIEEVTGRIGGMEETVQNLQKKVEKLQEKSLKPTILAISNACSNNIKPPVCNDKTFWQNYRKQFEVAAEANNWTSSGFTPWSFCRP